VKFFQYSWKNAGQLSIYPTATLTFVILFLGVKIRKTSGKMMFGTSGKSHKSLLHWINKTTAEKPWTMALMDAVIGGVICSLAAMGTIAAAEGRSWKNLVPLIFTVVLLATAAFFGARAGILGTILAALFFATFLFGPTGSISVANDAARSNLGWMLLIGIGFSFLFAPPSSGLRRH
jgi:K+-sensing histidine kinase KdpD